MNKKTSEHEIFDLINYQIPDNHVIKLLPDSLLESLRLKPEKLTLIRKNTDKLTNPLDLKVMERNIKVFNRVLADLNSTYLNSESYHFIIGESILNCVYSLKRLEDQSEKFSIRKKAATTSPEQNYLILEIVLNILSKNDQYKKIEKMSADEVKAGIKWPQLDGFLKAISNIIGVNSTLESSKGRIKNAKMSILKNLDKKEPPLFRLPLGDSQSRDFVISVFPFEISLKIKRSNLEQTSTLEIQPHLSYGNEFRIPIESITTDTPYFSDRNLEFHKIENIFLQKKNLESKLWIFSSLDHLLATSIANVEITKGTFYNIKLNKIRELSDIQRLTRFLYSQAEKDFNISLSDKDFKTRNEYHMISSSCLVPLIKSFLNNDPRFIQDYDLR